MSALGITAGSRPERRRYLALGWVLGVGAFALGTALTDPFVTETGPWTPVVAAVALFVLAVVAAYDGAGLPATAGFVTLVAAGLVPFLATVVTVRAIPPTGLLAVRVAFSAGVALVAGVVIGLVGFLVGAAGRWWRESRDARSRPATPGGSDERDDPSGPDESGG